MARSVGRVRRSRPIRAVAVACGAVLAVSQLAAPAPALIAASAKAEPADAGVADTGAGEMHLALLTGGVQLAILAFMYTMNQRKKSQQAKWEGADVQLLGICFAVGWVIRFLLPTPEGVTKQAWSMLAIFVSMICGVVIAPLPPSGVTLVALAAAVATNTVTFAEGLAAFTDEVVWLVLLAFFFAEGFQKTGLGDRIALMVIRAMGSTTLGVAYGLNFAELLVAAAMPCSAARAAAVFFPITLSVCRASGSDPAKGTEKKCGAFLVECCYQATATSSCIFLTGAAQNYFVIKLANEIGIDVPSPFKTWFIAALGPGLASFLLAPVLAYVLMAPQDKKTPDAPEAANKRLTEMGPAKDNEKVFGAVILAMVGLWATSSSTGIKPVVTALGGLAVLMMSGVLTWNDCAKNDKAWGTFTSFACLVGLASMLNNLGIVKWIASTITAQITAAGLSTVPSFFAILFAYWGVHYLFASQVAHVSALFQPFLLMMVQTGTPGLPAFFTLAFASNLFMTMTPYASAQSAVIIGGKYITQGEWYKVGFAYMIFYMALWVSVGAVWWRLIGLI